MYIFSGSGTDSIVILAADITSKVAILPHQINPGSCQCSRSNKPPSTDFPFRSLSDALCQSTLDSKDTFSLQAHSMELKLPNIRWHMRYDLCGLIYRNFSYGSENNTLLL